MASWISNYFGSGKNSSSPAASSSSTPSTSSSTEITMRTPPKDAVSSKRVVVLEIVPKRQSALIGKGGSTIKQFKSKYNVSIDVPDKNTNISSVFLFGKSKDTTMVHKEIEKTLGYAVPVNTPLYTTSFQPESRQRSWLIGKGGVTLKKIEKEGCFLDVPKDSKQPVRLYGTQSQVKKALVMINSEVYAKLKESPAASAKVIKVSSSGVTASSHSAAPDVKLIDLSPSKKICEALFFPEQDDGPAFKRFLLYLLSAKKSLEVCVFTITDDRISKILIHKARVGVKVRVITDDDQATALGSDIADFVKADIEVRMDATSAHMHHKFAVIDGTVLVNGSFNWTRQASSINAENVVISNDKALVRPFHEQFEKLWKAYKGNPLKL